jgi:hypothetical protein
VEQAGSRTAGNWERSRCGAMAGHQSTSPKGVRRVSEGYPEGLTGRYGGSAGPGLGWRRWGAGENGGQWIGQVAPTVDLLHDEAEIFEPGHGIGAQPSGCRGRETACCACEFRCPPRLPRSCSLKAALLCRGPKPASNGGSVMIHPPGRERPIQACVVKSAALQVAHLTCREQHVSAGGRLVYILIPKATL